MKTSGACGTACLRTCRPWLLCGEASCGHEGLLSEGEARGQKYLFRLRHGPGVKQLVRLLEGQGGWTAKRRVIVLRRQRERPAPEAPPALPWSALVVCGLVPDYEY